MAFKFLHEPEEEIIDYNSESKLIKETERLLLRHRLDLAKIYLNKDGGYTLRKFKRIFKREMAEFPDRYEILKPANEAEQSGSSSDVEDAAVAEGAAVVEGENEKVVPEVAKSESGDEKGKDASGSDRETAEQAAVDPEAEKLKLRAKIKKEIDEMNADSEEEHYEFEEEELEKLLLQVEEMELFTEEDAQKFLEKQHAAIQAQRVRATRKPKTNRNVGDVYDQFLKEKVTVQSQYENEWILDKENLD